MSFFEHLEELRWHILRASVAVLVAGVTIFIYRDVVFDSIILAPFFPEFPMNKLLCGIDPSVCFAAPNAEFQSISPYEQFTGAMSFAAVGGLVVTFPYILWEFWRFIRPGLQPAERKRLTGTVAVMSALFFIGVAFAYFVLTPFSIGFLANFQISSKVHNQWKIGTVVSLVTQLTVAGGLLFEFPVLAYYLGKIGILTTAFMREYRRHAYVALIFVAAIITPPDVLSQILIFIPLVMLYEVSIAVCGIAVRRREREMAAI